jgi:hypothetical protein
MVLGSAAHVDWISQGVDRTAAMAIRVDGCQPPMHFTRVTIDLMDCSSQVNRW